jgi:hypothetical protein
VLLAVIVALLLTDAVVDGETDSVGVRDAVIEPLTDALVLRDTLSETENEVLGDAVWLSESETLVDLVVETEGEQLEVGEKDTLFDEVALCDRLLLADGLTEVDGVSLMDTVLVIDDDADPLTLTDGVPLREVERLHDAEPLAEGEVEIDSDGVRVELSEPLHVVEALSVPLLLTEMVRERLALWLSLLVPDRE